MKVLHLISGGDTGGAKTHVYTLLRSLMKEIDIKVICFMEGSFYQDLPKTGIPYGLIKQKFRSDLTVIRTLVKLIRSERYHLIHAHGARANFVAMFLRPFISLPIISTMHSDYRMDFTQNLYKKLIFTKLNAVSLKYIDYFIAISRDFKDMLVNRGFDEEKIFTVYNAVDFNQDISYVDQETFLRKHKLEPAEYRGKTILGIIGRFDKVKGHEIFVRAAAQALKENPNLLFLLAGEGVEKQSLEKLCKELGISSKVKFLGFIQDIFSFINAIDINLCSSYSESFPYMLLEGALLQKPTISTAVGGIPDLIKDRETGLLVPSGDHKAMAKAMVLLSRDKTLRDQLGQGLYSYAKSNFSTENMKNTHINIYRSVLEKQKEKGKLFDVMLAGYYGFNNSGDEALITAIIDSLRKENQALRILLVSKNPKAATEKYGVFSINRSDFLKIRKYMKLSRLFVYGGGSIIQDITSTQSLIYYSTLLAFAKSLGLKIMLYANGIGPITKKRNIPLAKAALQLCDVITLREEESLAVLTKLGIEEKEVILSCDATLSLLPASKEKIKAVCTKEKLDMGKKYFVLSFRYWKSMDPGFVPKIAAVIDSISTSYGLTPLFVPMQYPDDATLCKEVMARLRVTAEIIKNELPVHELLGIIGLAEFVIAMRLHTLVYAFSVGKPLIGLVYDPKIKAFMEYIKQPYYTSIDSLDKDKVLQMAAEIMKEYAQIKKEISESAARLKEMSNKDAAIAMRLL